MKQAFRPAQLSDHGQFVRLFAELELDDPVPEPDRWAREMMPHIVLLEAGEGCVGYAMFNGAGDVGHIYHLVVDPQRRGEGHGKRLMQYIAERFRAAGSHRWCLNVKPANLAARKLYERFGMQNDYESFALRLTWSQVSDLEDSSQEATTRPLSPSDHAALEERFRLAPGQIALARSNPKIVLMGVGRDDASSLEGFASFNPSFPGAFPFRVARPSLARPLMMALRSHTAEIVTPDDDESSRWRSAGLQIVVEDDGALATLLRSAGATQALHILHYTGDLP